VVRVVALGLSLFVVGCTALGDLSEYSAGAAAASDPEAQAPEPSGSGGSSSNARLDGGAGAVSGGEGARPTVIEQPDPPPADVADASAPALDPPPALLARFVRLVADADVSQSPYTSAAELDVLDAAGAALARSGWVATADSAESTFLGGAPAALAIDGDPNSMWHTPWSDPALRPPHPHFLQLDMGAAHVVGGFRYLPRQDQSTDGSITDYRFFVSADGVEWGEPVAEGRFDATTTAHEVLVQ
jgi:F5/8 type C domain-containing protein